MRPLTRMREVVDICRQVWKREDKLSYQGSQYNIPLPEGQGTGCSASRLRSSTTPIGMKSRLRLRRWVKRAWR